VFSYKDQRLPQENQYRFFLPLDTPLIVISSLTTMPARHHLSTAVYTCARALPAQVWEAFESSPRSSNIMYAHASKTYQQEVAGGIPIPGQDWIVCSVDNHVELVLSCTENFLDSYPIFIFSVRPHSELTLSYIQPLVESLVYTLLDTVSPRRVYSVFAPEPITNLFASLWSGLTSIKCEPTPYYAANLTYCTRATLSDRRQTIFANSIFDLRLAERADLEQVAELCYGFASESEPFTLTHEESLEEAAMMIENKLVWIHRVIENNQSSIASIVCVTRTTDSVAAITKVYTNPLFRRRGCAERLVRHVSRHLLKTKQSIVLYVAHDNPAASKVYHRVGFLGLAPKSPVMDGVDRWLEIGFDQSQVDLGHW
jgi:ribosomal protein S18 acetylase RimI-like enzyme